MASKNLTEAVYNFLKYAILAGIVVGFGSLAVCSALVFDTAYIQKNPKTFLSETLIMGVLTAIPIAYLTYVRGTTSVKRIFSDSSLIFLKIVLLHVGFQLSGVYSVLFPASAPAALGGGGGADD